MVRPMDNDKNERRRFNRLKQVERERRLRIDEFVKASMGLPQGREFFWWLLELTRIGRNPFTGNALSTAFNSGELNVGQQIQSHLMEVAPADYLKMLTERQEKQDDRTDADPSSDDDGADDSST